VSLTERIERIAQTARYGKEKESARTPVRHPCSLRFEEAKREPLLADLGALC
jgi:hypothetical protein